MITADRLMAYFSSSLDLKSLSNVSVLLELLCMVVSPSCYSSSSSSTSSKGSLTSMMSKVRGSKQPFNYISVSYKCTGTRTTPDSNMLPRPSAKLASRSFSFGSNYSSFSLTSLTSTSPNPFMSIWNVQISISLISLVRRRSTSLILPL